MSTATESRSGSARTGITPFREVFGVDLRTLALLRVLLGIFIIVDLVLRARDTVAHYTDFGIMPRSVLADFASPGEFSIHMLSGTAAFQVALFLIAGVFALLLIAGWRTRAMTIISWVLLPSLQNRNSLIHSGEDQLVILLLFWAMFLPVGTRYSIDAALDDSEQDIPNAYFSVATVALLIQGMSVYFFSALLKSDPIWVPNGTAVYYALNLDYFVTPLALWFRQFELLLSGLTYYVWALELFGPILIFSPILHRPLRALFMVAFITMHIGFMLFLEIGIFPVISIIMVLTFTPGWMWDWLGARLKPTRRQGLHIWYDRDCGFCLKTVKILRTFLLLSGVPVRPAQDDPRVAAVLEAHNSWVVDQGEAQYLKWDAVRHIVACSPVFWPAATFMGVHPLRKMGDWFYLWVADNRSSLSRLTAKLMPWRPIRVGPSRIGNIVAALFLVLITVQNISTLPEVPLRLPGSVANVRQFFGLFQNWTMFAPHPEITSPWPVIRGELRDGSVVDVYNGAPGAPSFARPDVVSAVYENYRWRKYISILEDQTYEDRPQDLALNYGRYLCRKWNVGAAPDKMLSTFRIYFNVDWTTPPDQVKEFRIRFVWYHNCSG